MAFFVGIISKDSVYMGVDSRISAELPIFGRKYYDCGQSFGVLSRDCKLCAVNSGLLEASWKVFDVLTTKSVTTMDDLISIDDSLFSDIHSKILDNNEIVEVGTNEQLMGRQGVYCRLYEMQFRESR